MKAFHECAKQHETRREREEPYCETCNGVIVWIPLVTLLSLQTSESIPVQFKRARVNSAKIHGKNGEAAMKEKIVEGAQENCTHEAWIAQHCHI